MIESQAPDSVIADSLTAVEDAVGALRAASGQLGAAGPAAVTTAMGRLTTLAGQLDGLRVAVARQVRDRQLYRAAGARTLESWLRGDPRTADQAWAIARLAAADLPKITALLAGGAASLAQAGAASWQIARLPDLPRPTSGPDGSPADGSGPDGRPADGGGPDDSPADGGGPDGSPADGGGPDDGGRWAGLWQAGDVHAAADELFAEFLPRLDPAGVRQLGAHLYEAADVSGHAGQERSDFDRRGLRISESLHGTGEISGRLHAEAAATVIAAFSELGARSGPGDTRTKAQRWADALLRLITLAAGQPGHPAPADTGPGDGETDDDQPCHGDGHAHDSHAHDGHAHDGHAHDSHAHDSHAHDGHAHDGHGRADPAPATGPAAVPAGLRKPRIIVTVPLASLLGQPLAPGAVIGAATPISGQAARRLACDAEIIRLITTPPGGTSPAGTSGLTAGEQLRTRLNQAIASLPPPLGTPSAALDIGRKSPGWTPRQRDALHTQYGGRCAFPAGCTSPIEVIHHIRHWADGGPTTTDNGWPACGYHHWLIHEGGWQLLKHPDGRITAIPPPPGWQPGTIYRSGKPLREPPPVPAGPSYTTARPATARPARQSSTAAAGTATASPARR